MNATPILIYDTTLRDGAQGEGVSFSLQDKLNIARRLAEFGIDFVPNLYRVMAANPDYLEANWNKVKAVMFGSGKLDRLNKEIIAVAVSAVQGCRY